MGNHSGIRVYNNYRSDIATGHPGYANSNGAVGYFYGGTTQFANGVRRGEKGFRRCSSKPESL
jgi:hypothetical protein